MSDLISAREFAKRERCSHTLVNKAIKEGKLPVLGDNMLDSALVGTGWRKENRRNPRVETQVETVSTPEPRPYERLRDLTLPRDPIVPLNEYEAYWLKFTPTALDLAEELGITPAAVENLWHEKTLTKNAPLNTQLDEWDDFTGIRPLRRA